MSSGGELRSRVVTASLLAVIVLTTLFLRNTVFAQALLVVVGVLALPECRRIAGGPVPFHAIIIAAVFWLGSTEANLGAGFGIVGAILVAIGLARGDRSASSEGLARPLDPGALGLPLMLGAGLAGLHQVIRTVPPVSAIEGAGLFNPRPVLLILLFSVWAADVFAYFGGRAFGKHPLAPKLSPKKTWEGFACGIVGAILLAFLFGLYLQIPNARSLVIGAICGALGPVGDLLESGLKRRAGVKDSGALLPGHGGVLDRIDSLLLTAPLVALILTR